MSLLVLNSKGSDPEDFINYVTEQINFPKNAEVCLVQSHINRKTALDNEITISAGGNSLAFQFGTGDVETDRNTAGYTPHSPINILYQENDKMFPIKYKGVAEIQLRLADTLNDPTIQPISPLVGGWTATIPLLVPPLLTSPIELRCNLQVPAGANEQGQTLVKNVVIQPGHQGGIGTVVAGAPNNINTTNQFALPVQGVLGYANWVTLTSAGTIDETSGYVDLEPLWNTDTDARTLVYVNTAPATNVVGGAWSWQFDTQLITAREEVMRARGGILANHAIINSGDGPEGFNAMNGSNANLNPFTGGTDFAAWWEFETYDQTTGQGMCVFYARTITAGNKSPQDDATQRYEFARCRIPPNAQSIRICMRPTMARGLGVANKYCIEGFAGVITTATNTIPGAWIVGTGLGAPGYIICTDPEDDTPEAIPQPKFDLYRHLPIRQGINMPEAIEFKMNAIHHGFGGAAMSAPNQILSLPFQFGFNSLTVSGPQTQNFDTYFRPKIQKSTIGPSLGYINPWQAQTSANMDAAQAGLVAQQTIYEAQPMNHCLVVNLPDLPISGFYGNSTGNLLSGTLNMNAGGTSSAIIGVIPFGNPITWDSSQDTLDAWRGQYNEPGNENWIQLRNPHSFSITSLRVKLTDELGNNPRYLSENTTITIKIKAPRAGDDDSGLTRQGN